MLNMKQADLAKAADISAQALHSIERGASVARAPTLASIQRALEDAGAQFILKTAAAPAYGFEALTTRIAASRQRAVPREP